MGVTFSSRIVALAVAAALAAGAQALLPQAAAASLGGAGHPAGRPALGQAEHRTARPARLEDTAGRGLRLPGGPRPGRGRGGTGGALAGAVGKIFFTLGRTDYVCSGALVRRGQVDLVLTAAHCVTGGGTAGKRRWATSWTFVPGYRDGTEPYGQYRARQFYVSPRWTGPGTRTERYDVAFAVVTPVAGFGPDAVTRPLPPALPVTFAARQATAALPRALVLGYPALAPFSGQYANYCAGPARVLRSGPRAGGVTTRCAMTAGDSGGPWLTGAGLTGAGLTGSGAIAAVTAYKLAGEPRTLYGTVLGPAARRLYQAATRAWRTIPG